MLFLLFRDVFFFRCVSLFHCQAKLSLNVLVVIGSSIGISDFHQRHRCPYGICHELANYIIDAIFLSSLSKPTTYIDTNQRLPVIPFGVMHHYHRSSFLCRNSFVHLWLFNIRYNLFLFCKCPTGAFVIILWNNISMIQI